MAEHCPEHSGMVTQVAINKQDIHELREEHDAHCKTNGGGHVQRSEFNELKDGFKDLQKMLYKAGIAIALVSGGSSAFGPEVLSFLRSLFN